MRTTWIIAANAGRARIFCESDPAEPLQEIEDMVSNGARLRTQETETDRIGPMAAGSSGHGIGRSEGAGVANNGKAGAPGKLYQPAHTPADLEAEQFARDISKYLVDAHQEGRFEQLVISASPQFLGALRTCMDPHIMALIKFELNKDYTHVSPHELRGQLDAAKAKLH